MHDPAESVAVLRVLVADDIQASREHLCALVRELGHEVSEVASGRAALAHVQRHATDVVLLDLLMPDMDGFEATLHLRQQVQGRWLPVIVTSSLEGEEHFIEALHSGADDYLVRPISPALLDAKLRHYARVLGLQARLGALARRQRAIHDNILDAVITLGGDGVIEECNLAAMRIFASAQTPLVAQPCALALGARLETLLTQAEVTLQRADGTLFPAEVALSDWTDSGRVRHTLVLRDLTERRRMERMKDEFLATVSHELRTPLTSVLGALGLLASGAAGALPSAAVPLAEVAQRNGQRLSRLIDDILDLTKLEGNQLVLQLRPTRLDALLREALAANQGYAQRAGVTLSGDFSDAAPQVSADADRFLQVMANLLSNAIKHSAPQDVVRVQLDWSAAHVWVRVIDQGPGIAAQFRARMFEKFSQADGSDQRAQGGTGLGLYISRMLAQRMGARLRVDSVAGAGATFVVEFDVLPASSDAGVPWLLHIDSDVDARRRVADWLGSLCRVEGAADLQQARSTTAQGAPSLVLADPQAQGSAEEVCAALRALRPGGQLILYSDCVDSAFVQRMELSWLPKSAGGSEELQQAVRASLAPANQVKKA